MSCGAPFRIVLNDQHGTDAALLAPDNRAEVGIIDVAAFYACIHKVHTPPEEVPEGRATIILPRSRGFYTALQPKFGGTGRRRTPGSLPRSILCTREGRCPAAIHRFHRQGRRPGPGREAGTAPGRGQESGMKYGIVWSVAVKALERDPSSSLRRKPPQEAAQGSRRMAGCCQCRGCT